LYDVGHIVRMI